MSETEITHKDGTTKHPSESGLFSGAWRGEAQFYEEVGKDIDDANNQAAIGRKIEKEDIKIPIINRAGDTSIVFQRHGKYDRNHASETAGSITPESAEELYVYDKQQFDDLFKYENLLENSGDVYVLFVSSDTQYAGKGYRSLETAQVAEDAAIKSLEDAGLNPSERILNLNPDYKLARHDETNQDIRPIAGIREPQIFNPRDIDYLTHLQETHGYGDDETKTGLAPKAWAAHEMDAEAEVRETTGAESEDEILRRTKKSLAILERYAQVWHANNPDKRLVIWAASHYDTISPLVKEVDGVHRNKDGSITDAYQAVDYGGGVVINIPSKKVQDNLRNHRGLYDNGDGFDTLTRRASSKIVKLGHEAAAAQLEGPDITSPTKLDQPKF